MPKLLGRREIGLPPAGYKKCELTSKHVHTSGFVLRRLYLYYVIIVTTGL